MNRNILNQILRNYTVKTSVYPNPSGRWLWLRIHKTAGTSMWDGYLRDRGGVIIRTQNKRKHLNWLDTANLNEYFIWSFVRNPYDRFISTARMFGYHPDTFVDRFYEIRKPEQVVHRHTHEQWKFVCTESGEFYTDFIGRFEQLQSDFDIVCDKIGIPCFELPVLNKSDRKGDDLTEKVVGFVNEFYDKDFMLLGYDKL